jgi:hypothetical protein
VPITRRVVPIGLEQRAAADLEFIRETIGNAATFTALSGLGFVLVGLGALVAGVLAQVRPEPMDRVLIWLVDAVASVAIGFATTARKARRAEQPLLSGPFRKFTRSFAPAIVAGAILTALLVRDQSFAYLPCLWLLCYGAGLAASGSLSVSVVPAMGGSFMALGAIAAVAPPAWGNALLLLGFGGLHLGFGTVIARSHGG